MTDTAVAADPFSELTLRLKEALACDRCSFFLVDRAANEVWSRAAMGLEIALRLPMHRGVVGYVARTGRTLRLRDAYNDPRFDRSVDVETGYRTRSMLTMAVRRGSQVVGVLQALNKLSGAFTAQDEATMQRFCAEAAEVAGRA